MHIPEHLIIFETGHWVLNHHMASALPGYLMLGAKTAGALGDLPEIAQAELGVLLAKVQRIMQSELQPEQLYISRYGHEAGWPIHFHCIPVYAWVEELFWKDERYRALRAFDYPPAASPTTDGAELTLFIWREFGENPTKPPVVGPGREQVVAILRRAFEE
ncbi:HIT family protein [Pseudomonas sp. 21LCFQ02]|uniref:HIT family protein n=1 Tax=unclassified Pseudomonas TaxID=196821 RepID=UPI00209AD0B2|nr:MULTISPECIES: HIT family protein [unclassified Pseudomonas]MCO8170341.1 HIT family protein [Pseudomonas sp. 21LCFQ02]MCQ9425765.1 HIT family protein [Pseudomonas sp. LJDD11]